MKLKMFSIYDSKAEAFLQPFFSQTTGTAIRSFESAANEVGHDFNKYAGDYTLFELGEFDQESGKTTSRESQLNLGLAMAFIRKPTPDLQEVAHQTTEILKGINR